MCLAEVLPRCKWHATQHQLDIKQVCSSVQPAAFAFSLLGAKPIPNLSHLQGHNAPHLLYTLVHVWAHTTFDLDLP